MSDLCFVLSLCIVFIKSIIPHAYRRKDYQLFTIWIYSFIKRALEMHVNHERRACVVCTLKSCWDSLWICFILLLYICICYVYILFYWFFCFVLFVLGVFWVCSLVSLLVWGFFGFFFPPKSKSAGMQ